VEGTLNAADTERVNIGNRTKGVPGLRGIALLTLLLFGLLPGNAAYAYLVQYKEQYYRLFHLHYIQYPDDTMENIYWLEQASKADFANPLYALADIQDKTQWEKYRYLFNMHINIKLVEQYLLLGSKWDKRNAYFYNAPWKEQNLESLDTAETCYRTAAYYWGEAKQWAVKAGDKKFRWINLERAQFWEDEVYRMGTGDLDYGATVDRELARLQKVRQEFQAMDENTY